MGTPQQRTTETDWHPRLALPIEIRDKDATGTLLRTTRYTYDGDNAAPSPKGDLTRQEIHDPASGQSRVWTWTHAYHPTTPGALLQKVEDGPRSDVADLTTWDYYPPDAACPGAGEGPGRDQGCRGQLKQLTNALGHVTQITRYSPHGQPETLLDPNGVVTTLTYDPRQRLVSHSVGSETTRYQYDPAGNLTRITRPDGSYVDYQYDAAHRLTGISDALGNRVSYTLDGLGNRTGEQILNAANTVLYNHSRGFDALGRLWQDIGALNQTATYGHDANGNLTTLDGPRTDVTDATSQDYDALDRLWQVIHPDGGSEQYTRDALDQLTQVQDPNQLATTYAPNALGDVTQTGSPDTGTTTRTFDAAGNVATETDARGYITTYTYDALNRVMTRTSSEPSTPAYTYLYDFCTHGIGRLCEVLRDGGMDLYFNYDAQGRLTYKLQSTTAWEFNYALFAYDPHGRLSQITYPTGRSVTYAYDPQGRVTQVRTQAAGGGSQILARDISYFPFAGPQHFYFGNNTLYWETRDQDYRPQYRFSGPYIKLADYDEAGNLQGLTDVAGPRQTYGYDANGRLIGFTDTLPGGLDSLAWAYDLNGNRTSETRNGTAQSYDYAPAGSNELYQFGSQYRITDHAGHTAFGTTQGFLGYNGYGRLVQSSNQNTRYEYNALGERVKQAGSGAPATQFLYGQSGELLFERDSAGHTKAYVWLDGHPLARIDDDSAIYYYHTDRLGTPQALTNAAANIVWQAGYEPFGKAQVKVNSVENNLRFPGQYYDQETGLHYNYFRDYDPVTGRYIEADPIGLAGGLNPYLYAEANPLMYTDPLGLWAWGDPLPQGAVDFSAGFGDVLTFGLTKQARSLMDINSVNRCSKWYTVGELAGVAATTATGFVGGTRWFARQASPSNWSNFSHSGTPASWQRGSWWSRTGNRANGDYIPTSGTRPDLHDLMDATAAGIGGKYPTWPAWRRLINRMPYTPGGALYGGASAAMNDCECSK